MSNSAPDSLASWQKCLNLSLKVLSWDTYFIRRLTALQKFQFLFLDRRGFWVWASTSLKGSLFPWIQRLQCLCEWSSGFPYQADTWSHGSPGLGADPTPCLKGSSCHLLPIVGILQLLSPWRIEKLPWWVLLVADSSGFPARGIVLEWLVVWTSAVLVFNLLLKSMAI